MKPSFARVMVTDEQFVESECKACRVEIVERGGTFGATVFQCDSKKHRTLQVLFGFGVQRLAVALDGEQLANAELVRSPPPFGRCTSCQRHQATTRVFGVDPVCFDCGFWLRKREQALATTHEVVVDANDWRVYSIGKADVPDKVRGFGGASFLITFEDAPFAPVSTRNLWHSGQVPVHLRANWPRPFAKVARI